MSVTQATPEVTEQEIVLDIEEVVVSEVEVTELYMRDRQDVTH